MNKILVQSKTKDKGYQTVSNNECGSNAELAFKTYKGYLNKYKDEILEDIPESGEYIIISFIGGDKYTDYEMKIKDIPNTVMIPIKYKEKFPRN